MQKYSRGMVFGVFDGLHPGHQYFLTKAARQCEELVVVVTLDDVVLHFKNRLPKFNLIERMNAIKSFADEVSLKITVVPGDQVSEMGHWSVLKNHQPEVILLGHDQERLGQEVVKFSIPTFTMAAYFPEKYKSSLIHHASKADSSITF